MRVHTSHIEQWTKRTQKKVEGREGGKTRDFEPRNASKSYYIPRGLEYIKFSFDGRRSCHRVACVGGESQLFVPLSPPLVIRFCLELTTFSDEIFSGPANHGWMQAHATCITQWVLCFRRQLGNGKTEDRRGQMPKMISAFTR